MPKQDAIIQQIKHIKVLKEDGILSAEEFNEERDKLVTEQEELQQYCTITLPIFPAIGETL